MEHLFSPCTRLYDLLESRGSLLGQGRDDFTWLRELNLDVSTEEFLSAERAFTYSDLYAMLGNGETIAWLNPHTAVARAAGRVMYGWGQSMLSCRFRFAVDGKDIVALAHSREDILEICYVVLRLLAASVVHLVILRKGSSRNGSFINATSLAYLMEQCQSLKVLKLEDLEMDENHCLVLGAYSRPDLEIVLRHCKLTSAGTNALAEVLGRNQGPTKLDSCYFENFIIANGLRGNSRLQSFTPLIINIRDVGNQDLLTIAGALRENKGLVDLNMRCDGFNVNENDEIWGAVCDSLKTHPTLEDLNLRSACTGITTAPVMTTKTRIQALLDMMKINTSIHTIRVDCRYSEHDLFRGSVIPYLETNRFRPRVRAIQKTRPIAYRAKVLGRALLSARTDANSFWMLLSGNAEVAFPSTTATASLPSPATTRAAISNVAPILATPVATGPPVANGATPNVGQKRKALP
jgi:hypothetical protein